MFDTQLMFFGKTSDSSICGVLYGTLTYIGIEHVVKSHLVKLSKV